jgi:hypothetical protein
MHQYNNVILERHKHVSQIINPFILLSNYLIMFPNLHYHTIPQNELITYKCTYTQTHTNKFFKNINLHTYIHKCTYTQTHTNKSQNNICIYIHT